MLCTGRLRAVPPSSVDDDVIRGLIELCAMQREYTEYICHHDRVHNSIVADGQGVFFTWRLSHQRERERERERESALYCFISSVEESPRRNHVAHADIRIRGLRCESEKKNLSSVLPHIFMHVNTHVFIHR